MRALLSLSLVLALAGCEIGFPVGATPTTPPTSTGTNDGGAPSDLLSVVRVDLGGLPAGAAARRIDAALTDDSVGLALTFDTAVGTSVAFLSITLDGGLRDAPTVVTSGADGEAGASIAWDRPVDTYYLAWAEPGVPVPTFHLQAVGPNRHLAASKSVPMSEDGWTPTGLGLKLSDSRFLVGGVLLPEGSTGSSAPFIFDLGELTGDVGSYDKQVVQGNFHLTSKLLGAESTCVSGSCQLVVRDVVDPHAQLTFGSTAAAFNLYGMLVTDSQGVQTTHFSLSSPLGSGEAGAFPRVTTDGSRLVSFGQLDSGDLRLQTATGTALYRGGDGPAQAFGAPTGETGFTPIALALDGATGDALYALGQPRADGMLVFGSRQALDKSMGAKVSGSHLRVKGRARTSATVQGEPVLLCGHSRCFAIWLEGTQVMFAELPVGP